MFCRMTIRPRLGQTMVGVGAFAVIVGRLRTQTRAQDTRALTWLAPWLPPGRPSPNYKCPDALPQLSMTAFGKPFNHVCMGSSLLAKALSCVFVVCSLPFGAGFFLPGQVVTEAG